MRGIDNLDANISRKIKIEARERLNDIKWDEIKLNRVAIRQVTKPSATIIFEMARANHATRERIMRIKP